MAKFTTRYILLLCDKKVTIPCNFLLLRDKGLIVVMEGYEGFDGLDVEHGLVDVAEEGLLANVLNPTSSLLKIVPGNQPKVFLKVIFLS